MAHSGKRAERRAAAAPIRTRDNAADEITGTVVLLHDVTEMRGYTRQMSYQATHDALTGLVNRREFESRTEEDIDSVLDDQLMIAAGLPAEAAG